jgi:cell division protein FtsX
VKVTEKEDMIRKLQNQHDDVVAQLKSENNTIQKAAQVTLLEKERAQAKQQTLQELVLLLSINGSLMLYY